MFAFISQVFFIFFDDDLFIYLFILILTQIYRKWPLGSINLYLFFYLLFHGDVSQTVLVMLTTEDFSALAHRCGLTCFDSAAAFMAEETAFH